MVVNFRTREINRDTYKLTRISTLIKKIYMKKKKIIIWIQHVSYARTVYFRLDPSFTNIGVIFLFSFYLMI